MAAGRKAFCRRLTRRRKCRQPLATLDGQAGAPGQRGRTRRASWCLPRRRARAICHVMPRQGARVHLRRFESLRFAPAGRAGEAARRKKKLIRYAANRKPPCTEFRRSGRTKKLRTLSINRSEPWLSPGTFSPVYRSLGAVLRARGLYIQPSTKQPHQVSAKRARRELGRTATSSEVPYSGQGTRLPPVARTRKLPRGQEKTVILQPVGEDLGGRSVPDGFRHRKNLREACSADGPAAPPPGRAFRTKPRQFVTHPYGAQHIKAPARTPPRRRQSPAPIPWDSMKKSGAPRAKGAGGFVNSPRICELSCHTTSKNCSKRVATFIEFGKCRCERNWPARRSVVQSGGGNRGLE